MKSMAESQPRSASVCFVSENICSNIFNLRNEEKHNMSKNVKNFVLFEMRKLLLSLCPYFIIF